MTRRRLSPLGQWREYLGLRVGVLTITRGEGGGNYLSDVEGDELGELREAEQRAALAQADVSELTYLDRLDFFYTASAPLTLQVWGEDTLADVTVVIRRMRPEVIVTMNPSPVDGNHGNHQAAARLATEAYLRAGDPDFFPEQIEAGLQPWRPLRLLRAVRGSSAEIEHFYAELLATVNNLIGVLSVLFDPQLVVISGAIRELVAENLDTIETDLDAWLPRRPAIVIARQGQAAVHRAAQSMCWEHRVAAGLPVAETRIAIAAGNH